MQTAEGVKRVKKKLRPSTNGMAMRSSEQAEVMISELENVTFGRVVLQNQKL